MPIRTWAVGLFVVVGLGLLTAVLFLIGDRQKSFSKHVEFETQFSNLSGLAPGAKVRVSGFDGGKIKEIFIPKKAAEKFRLRLEIEEQLHSLVHTDSVVSIETEGVVGDKFILIKRGSDQTAIAQSGATLTSKEPLDISAMMDQASELLKDVNATVGDVRGRVDQALNSLTATVNHADGLITGVSPNIQQIARDGSQVTGNINTLVADMNAGKGPAGLLLRDDETKRQLATTIANAKATSASISDASARATQVITDFQSRELAQKAQVTLDNVQAVSQQLNTTLKDALDKDSMGADGAENLRQTLSNINRSTANLADDTEALKHNFLFRGFFKKRGFFNLDQVSPAEYRQACERQGHAGVRLWLQASTLVMAGPDGEEFLSEEGRRHIDTQVAPVLETLSGHLIVVEGYAASGSSTQQFVVARQRADQVRRYLEARYHLKHSDIGIVELGGTPPSDAQRPNWDGAAIMLLARKSRK